MKKLLLTILCIIAICTTSISQTLTVSTINNIAIKYKVLINKVETEQQIFNSNKDVFQIETLNRIFITRLKNDGIITTNCSQINMQLTESSLIVNNELMSDIVKDKYLTLYFSFMRKTLCASCAVKYEINDAINSLLAVGN